MVVEVGLPESESIYIPTTFLILPLLPLAYEGSESMKQDRTSRQNHFSEPRKKKKKSSNISYSSVACSTYKPGPRQPQERLSSQEDLELPMVKFLLRMTRICP